MKTSLLFFAVILLAQNGQSANILGVFPMGASSHYILASKLMLGLAEAGHNITFISPYEFKTQPKKGSITNLVLEGAGDEFQKVLKASNLFEQNKQNSLLGVIDMNSKFLRSVNNTLNDKKVNELLKSDQKFDAVIMEQFSNDALKVFAYLYDCPLIILNSVGPNNLINPTVGNPEEISYIPNMLVKASHNKVMTFFERIKNLLVHVISVQMNNYIFFPQQNEVLHRRFPDAPEVTDLYLNASLVLLNSHSSVSPAQPLVPNMVEIGGYFIDPPKKLPKDLQEFLDNAKDGAIYFSMGSNLRSKDITAERKKIILKVLGELKQKVIWKFEEELPGKPDNILIKSWLPQQDILAHPNIKLFVTHGGLLSITETIYHGVPILAIPIFGDQPMNAEIAQSAGYGLKLSYTEKDFTEEKFSHALDEILYNPKYRDTAQKISKLFHDRPMKPMDTAVYWVDYVIRNKGAGHLRVGSIHQKWYQYHLVDMILFLLLSLIVFVNIVKFVLVKVFKAVRDRIIGKTKVKAQ
ncbi:UDP-glucuronosyltransferase 2C1-like [Sitophilus oryzae]|uniref:UDP-glucuronosyltransferase n=1 Tax=Sitophilus oryzae TaxID=7048 RepID=A0A6J2XBA5_SITOR|nr:UDP-glucuronosyltransferase 2C1-like [Sitophilus oryzae]